MQRQETFSRSRIWSELSEETYEGFIRDLDTGEDQPAEFIFNDFNRIMGIMEINDLLGGNGIDYKESQKNAIRRLIKSKCQDGLYMARLVSKSKGSLRSEVEYRLLKPKTVSNVEAFNAVAESLQDSLVKASNVLNDKITDAKALLTKAYEFEDQYKESNPELASAIHAACQTFADEYNDTIVEFINVQSKREKQLNGSIIKLKNLVEGNN